MSLLSIVYSDSICRKWWEELVFSTKNEEVVNHCDAKMGRIMSVSRGMHPSWQKGVAVCSWRILVFEHLAPSVPET